MTMHLAPETRQHVLLKTLGVLLIAVGISMLINLWAHEHALEASPAAFEDVFVAGSPGASTAPACLKKNRTGCTAAPCVRVSALGTAGIDSDLPETPSNRRCRRRCRR